MFKKLILASLLAALAVVSASPLSTAYARHGADDPAGHNAGDVRGEGPGHP